MLTTAEREAACKAAGQSFKEDPKKPSFGGPPSAAAIKPTRFGNKDPVLCVIAHCISPPIFKKNSKEVFGTHPNTRRQRKGTDRPKLSLKPVSLCAIHTCVSDCSLVPGDYFLLPFLPRPSNSGPFLSAPSFFVISFILFYFILYFPSFFFRLAFEYSLLYAVLFCFFFYPFYPACMRSCCSSIPLFEFILLIISSWPSRSILDLPFGCTCLPVNPAAQMQA
ncbi:MAG UNVERIFIED_CONTAM: hypothetical protein LVR29_05210 [Microcystis novacekii LVE1205-3]